MELENVESMLSKLISAFFKKKRLEFGLTGKQMGALLNVSQQQISRYERGVTAIPLSYIAFILYKNDSSLLEFFCYIENKMYIEQSK